MEGEFGKLQATFTRIFHTKLRNSIEKKHKSIVSGQNVSGTKEKSILFLRHIVSRSQYGCLEWMSAIPSTKGHSLDNVSVAISLRLALRLSITPDRLIGKECVCRTKNKDFITDEHLELCWKSQFARTYRHNDCRDDVCHVAGHKCHLHVSKEPLAQVNQDRGDALIDYGGGDIEFYDFGVTCPLQEKFAKKISDMLTPLVASKELAKRKRAQYEQALKAAHPEFKYIPVIFESTGAFPREAEDLIRKLSLRNPEFPGSTWACASPKTHIAQTLSVSIAYGTCKAIRNTIRLNLSSFPGLLVDSRW